jgi:hypothetical protein
MEVRVTDIRATKATLDENDVPYVEEDSQSIRVPADFACGVALDFTELAPR